MPINLAGSYGAGGLHDALLEIVKQRMLEQELAQRQEENQFQRLRAERLDKQHADETTYQRGQDTLNRARLTEQDKIAAEGRTAAEEEKRRALLTGLPAAEQRSILGSDESTGQTVQAPPNPAIPGGMPSYLIGQNPQIDPITVRGMKIHPQSMEDLDKAASLDEKRKEESAIRIAQAKPPNRSIVSGFVGPHDEPVQMDEFGRAYIGTQEVPISQLKKVPPQSPPVVVVGPNGPMIVDRSAGTGRAVQEVGPGGQPTGVNIGNKLPPTVVAKIGDVDSVITGINDLIGLKKDEWLGPLQGWMTKARIETPGMDVPKDLADFAALTSTIRNATIKAITGAQMSEQEAKRITEQIPEFTDKPSVWLANAQATIKNLTELRAKMLALSGAQSDTVGVTGGRGGGPGPGAGRGGPAVGSLVGNFIVTDPKGGKHAFQTQAEADAFKKAAGIK